MRKLFLVVLAVLFALCYAASQQDAILDVLADAIVDQMESDVPTTVRIEIDRNGEKTSTCLVAREGKPQKEVPCEKLKKDDIESDKQSNFYYNSNHNNEGTVTTCYVQKKNGEKKEISCDKFSRKSNTALSDIREDGQKRTKEEREARKAQKADRQAKREEKGKPANSGEKKTPEEREARKARKQERQQKREEKGKPPKDNTEKKTPEDREARKARKEERQKRREEKGKPVNGGEQPKPPKEGKPNRPKKEKQSTGGNDKVAKAGQSAANYAKKQVGKKYCTGAGNPDRRGPKCFDCTGLVSKAWEQAGFKGDGSFPWSVFPESPDWYPKANGIRTVSAKEMQPGDVLWTSGHVGMYVGHGKVVEAANENLGVREVSLSSFNYKAIYRPK
jgi:cell wall-associated NlpC family hydrolase